jgi:hypothetical protein
VKRQPDLPEVPPKPRRPRVMRQPRKAWYRARVAKLEAEVAELRAERSPWWRRLFNLFR